MTHYVTLGVTETATQEEIKKAYRKLAMQHHPDKGGDTNKFQEIQAAYDAINDDQKRAQYDAERSGRGGMRFSMNGSDMDGMPGGMEDILRNFGFAFGQGFAQQGDPFAAHRQPRRNKDLQVEVVISLADTLNQHSKTISIQTTNGDRYPVEVNLPRGITPNSTIKYANLGDNFFGSLPRGDLYVRVRVESDHRFNVDNLDLIKTIDIDCLHAIIGTTTVVEGLDGRKFELSIPSGTQYGSRFRITQQGLYAMNQNFRGNLIVVINVTVPSLPAEKLELVKSLLNPQ